MRTPESVLQRLHGREQSGTIRSLPQENSLADFSSNDYLGLSKTGLLKDRTDALIAASSLTKVGATGSRLLSGNSEFTETLEKEIALFHGAESALIFNSGYDANTGVLSALPTRHDTVITDELSHASIIDGVRLSWAKRKWSFKHNDVQDLREKIQRATGDIYVVVESVYSMDGDFAPLDELITVCNETGAHLIVDEAHATGIFGHLGTGRVSELGLEQDVFIRVHTFGKALGTHGAVALCSSKTREFLINFCRSFIYSTALDLPTQYSIKAAYELLESGEVSPVHLFLLIHDFRNTAKRLLPELMLESISPIQGIIIPGAEKARSVSKSLHDKGFDVKAVLAPTVPHGKERLRICLHSFNAPPEIQGLLHAIKEAL